MSQSTPRIATARTAGEPMTAEEIVDLLGLTPHPEGGFFREMFRDAVSVGDGAGTPALRAASTAIYFLLREGEVSRWHRVDAAEVWHFYAGAPLALSIAPPDGPAETLRLGIDLASGERPQAVVPPKYWQQARSLGGYSLVGCTVAPGFDFARFELAPDGFDPPRTA